MRALGRTAAIVLLLLIPISFVEVYDFIHPAGITIRTPDGYPVVVGIADEKVRALGVRLGDRVDLSGLSIGERVLLDETPLFKSASVKVLHAGRVLVVPYRSVVRKVYPPLFIAELVVEQATAIGSLILGAIVLWRRPSAMAALYAVYSLNLLNAGVVTQAISFLPEPALSFVAAFLELLLGQVPTLALVAFALRFPGPLRGDRGRLITRVADAGLVALAALALGRILVVPFFDYTDLWLDSMPSFVATGALIIIVFSRYARTRGDDRRRLGWVAVGTVVAALSTCTINLAFSGVIALPNWIEATVQCLAAALPATLAYAILRHRVLDLGLAINRTLVFSTITAAMVVAVGAVDWLSGKVLGNTHLSAVFEAAVTIALGAALSWFHRRVERGVDRLIFRRRYVAATRIEERVEALGFACKSGTVDTALVDEVMDVLHLGSAAVFRGTEASGFARIAAIGWDECSAHISAYHLLLRTLRARERAVDLVASSINDDTFPNGRFRPDVAIPIIVKHEFLGFAVYGHRVDETVLGPEERELLVRLVAAAAAAYDSIDAAEWRRRAIELQRLPALG